MQGGSINLVSLMPKTRPLAIVNGVVYHYHRAKLEELVTEEEQGQPYRPTFPFLITLETYKRAGYGKWSIWLVRQWRAESYSILTYSGVIFKPTQKRERLIFDNAVPVQFPGRLVIRPRDTKDLV